MEVKVLKDDKESTEVELDNLTLVELLRVYLNKDSAVTFAAWKRDHPTKPCLLKVEAKGKSGKKAINDAVSAIEKDLDNVEKEFGKLK